MTPRPDRPTRGTCRNCNGKDRLLRYAQGTMCTKHICQHAAMQAVAERRADLVASGGEPNNEKEEEFSMCWKVIEVLGQREHDEGKLSRVQRRNKRARDDREVEYLVLGRFGRDAHDAGEFDTRWVESVELKAHITKQELRSALQALAKRVTELAATASSEEDEA